MPPLLFFRVLLVGLLVLANAFFVAAEFALVSARRTWLQQRAAQGDPRAEVALRLIGQLNRVLNAVQLGITMASLGLGWIGELTLAGMLQPGLSAIHLGSPVIVHATAATVAFLVITFLHVVLGEMVPKQLALERAERMSLLVARPMVVFINAVQHPLALLDSSSSYLAQRLGARPAGAPAHSHSAEELKMLATGSYRSGALPAYQQEMIHNVIDLGDVLVREVMVPRPNIVSVSVNATLEELSQIVTADLYSRIPVYQDSPDQLIGVLYTKDLLRVWHERQAVVAAGGRPPEFVLRGLVRDLPIVPETKPIDQLLQEFQQQRRHMAIVVDEFGGTAGLVTLEDVLEQLVGEIQDEYDWERPPGLRLGERTLVLDAQINIRDLENQYDVQLPRDLGFETLAGFVLHQCGRIPSAGDSFLYSEWRFTVLDVQNHRVARVKLEKLEEAPATHQSP